MTLLYRLKAQEKFPCVLSPLESVVTEFGEANTPFPHMEPLA